MVSESGQEAAQVDADDLAEVVRRLEARGVRLTAQRRLVVEGLMRQRAALTPRELHAELRAQHPGLGLATVYRTLESLQDVQAATRFEQPNHEGRYVYCSLRHHHHLLCTRCGHVVEIAGCMLAPIERALHRSTRFQINEHSLTFYGFCAACRS
jgi:Fur family ferric uptake transcriptional regulator